MYPTPPTSPAAQQLLRALLEASRKRSVFVSYHHDSDQGYYDTFSQVFATAYQIVRDNSLDRVIDSDDPEYVMRRIRENYITGTSCTLVLCGPMTRWRKYVDWEIKATLDKQHGLIGVHLPNNPPAGNGGVHKPDRLQDNVDSGYALWLSWADLVSTPIALQSYIEVARGRPKSLIRNLRPMRRRNGD